MVNEGLVAPEYKRSGRRIMMGLAAIAVLLGLGVVILYAYNKGRQAGESKIPPVIQAQEGPIKVRPSSPGGMSVPNQDKEVFTRLEANKQGGRVETLLPPPEKPVELPSVPSGEIESAASPQQDPAPKGSAKPAKPTKSQQPFSKNDRKGSEVKPSGTPDVKTTAPAKATVKMVPPKAAQKSASRRYRVQISSLRSEAALKRSWALLRTKHKDLLGALPLIVERTILGGGRGTYYRMQLGPLTSRGKASALCNKLKQRKLGCLVVRR